MEPNSGQPDDRFMVNDPPPGYAPEHEEVMRVIYQSNQDGELVGVESSLVMTEHQPEDPNEPSEDPADIVQTSGLRLSSTLPSVAEESISNGGGSQPRQTNTSVRYGSPGTGNPDESTSRSVSRMNEYEDFESDNYEPVERGNHDTSQFYDQSIGSNIQAPIYSTVSKRRMVTDGLDVHSVSSDMAEQDESTPASQFYHLPTYSATSTDTTTTDQPTVFPANQHSTGVAYSVGAESETSTLQADQYLDMHGSGDILPPPEPLSETYDLPDQRVEDLHEEDPELLLANEKEAASEEDIAGILSRQQPGAAESGSFRNNFKKRLGISHSSNERDLEAHRHKLLKSQDNHSAEFNENTELEVPSKFKRTHSVSFNVNSSRSGRLSVDLRNLPSYLTVKRASIVDVARGAVSSLIHSFGSNSSSAGGGSGVNSNRRDSSPDGEPIFEEPIAPTLSLGQRVAMVRNNGTEFGTVGWIGQLPGVEDDWVVGVIFDNMIGNCDGAYNGIRYFYSRENYAMFVPLSSLTKTDNYIGRPETGTMLSRMSVSLKPGQLISIQRSSIRLQHCFLNAPHQRVGHDVRAVSNRLHCQCHNCGPCAHLTKQGRFNALPPIATHHAPNKKNSLAHAAVELLAHHHHHYHDEEAHEPEDYQFGDNAAHACNFVRYSCCQQSGRPGHDFSADCGLVRPELLDNLIHAPRAPHRRSRPRRRAQKRPAGDKLAATGLPLPEFAPALGTLDSQASSVLPSKLADESNTLQGDENDNDHVGSPSLTTTSSRSSSRSISAASQLSRDELECSSGRNQEVMSPYQLDGSSSYQGSKLHSTFDSSHLSIRQQQRFISQRDSSALIRSNITSDDYYFVSQPTGGGLAGRFRRCFACLFKRHRRSGELDGRGSLADVSKRASKESKKRRRKDRKRRRKLSARNRMLEYRRRQSTFVPSTLAKPQEDFASHGIVLPENDQHSNSDYSSFSRSYSNSSGSSSSPSNSGGHDAYYPSGAGNSNHHHHHHHLASDPAGAAADAFEPFRNSETLVDSAEHGYIPNQEEPLKSNWDTACKLSYDDYNFSDSYGSYKKEGFSRDSNLTDLGFDSMNGNSSYETLKQIVDQRVNEQEALPVCTSLERDLAALSPVRSQSQEDDNDQAGWLDISSPSVSIEAGADGALAGAISDGPGADEPASAAVSSRRDSGDEEQGVCQVFERLGFDGVEE